jgi:alkylation response protein AidB-like acyl-CoA dehydrogenase
VILTRPDTQTQEWLAKAEALGDLVAQYRDDGERGRRLPQPIFEALRDAGLFHVWVPQRFGGAELPLDQVVPILEEIARQDGAVGWSLAIAMESGLLSAYLPARAADAIYAAAPQAVIAGSVQPRGRAIAVTGGYRVSGRWPLASGCQHADWLCGNCVVYEGDTPHRDPSGTALARFFFWPAAEGHILDTWHSTGLRGTGSHDIQVDDVFVPEEYQCAFTDQSPHPGPLFRAGIFSVLSATIAAVALGIARAAIDEFGQLAQEKIPHRHTLPLTEHALVHERVAEAEALVRAGRAFLMQSVHEISTAAADGREVTLALRTLKDLASCHATRSATQAVDLMFSAAGTSSIYASSRLDRCFRDVHTMGQHFGVGIQRMAAAGEFLLRSYAASSYPPAIDQAPIKGL